MPMNATAPVMQPQDRPSVKAKKQAEIIPVAKPAKEQIKIPKPAVKPKPLLNVDLADELNDEYPMGAIHQPISLTESDF